MDVLPSVVKRVIDEFGKIPGVGPKSAARMSYHFIRAKSGEARKLADSLNEMSDNILFCKQCFNVSEKELCPICSSNIRDQKKVCVVEEPLDVVAFEETGVYNGLYFVLGGVISPADGISARELRFRELRKFILQHIEKLEGELESDSSDRDKDDGGKKVVLEIIMATNPSLEGEATASYTVDILEDLIREGKIEITRLAMGLPTGADLEYADRLTLKRALDGRRTF